MKKKFVPIVVAGLLTMSPFLTEIGNAETLGSIQQRQNRVERQKRTAQRQMNKIDEQLSELKTEIEKLDRSIMDKKESIQQKESEIEQQKNEISRLREGTQTLNEQIAQRTEIMGSRLAAHQKSRGATSQLQVLLGSQDFFDFIARMGTIGEIMNAERELIQQLEKDLRLVEEKEKAEYREQVAFENQLEELRELEDALNEKSAEKESALKELEAQEEKILEEFYVLEREEEFLKEQEAAIIKAAEEAARKAREEEERLAAQKAEEEERQAAQEAQEKARQTVQEAQEAQEARTAAQESQTREESQNTQSQSNNRGDTPPITNNLFMRPANGPVTSEFGRRVLNGRAGFHFGIDIGKRGATVPVVAAADGVVIRSDYSTSYGNVVFLTHNLNGKVYTTVYAHLDTRAVRSGQVVEKGQVLGNMGNTGFSFGAHLHFEIHRGEWNIEKSNAVDPRLYIDF